MAAAAATNISKQRPSKSNETANVSLVHFVTSITLRHVALSKPRTRRQLLSLSLSQLSFDQNIFLFFLIRNKCFLLLRFSSLRSSSHYFTRFWFLFRMSGSYNQQRATSPFRGQVTKNEEQSKGPNDELNTR